MPRKKYSIPPPIDIVRKLKNAGFSASNKKIDTDVSFNNGNGIEDLLPLSQRVEGFLGIINNPERIKTNMLFFVMYDIESNKVRRLIAKYLLRQGCFRIQNSIFLADLSPDKYRMIKTDLTETQAAYENNDSILVVPISTDHLKSMRIIGKNIDVDIITGTRNTLFF